ncbi:MAG TPA: pyridoxal-dependent decarboxylase [Segeticoccus sp.]|nr:pyridoxal-dependent decarboxylase [Segeticoccus sp.]
MTEDSTLHALFTRAAVAAADFREGLAERPVRPDAGLDDAIAAFGGPLPEHPVPPEQVLGELLAAAEPGLMASAGPRFFGFVNGGALPAASAADLLATGWDQCPFTPVLSPAAAGAEEAAGHWIKELLGIPQTASVGFVTGAQGANTVGLAAGRHHVLAERGWDVERDGLTGGPRVRVVASEERHATIDRSLKLLGLGTSSLQPVRTGPNGETDVDDLVRVLARRPDQPTIVCLQVGNVNTGACDDLRAGVGAAHRHGAWVHVDGAFGLWAAANPATAHLLDGVELADSWGCDGHKWLNVPYDSAFAICSRPLVQATAVSYSAAYLTGSGGPVPRLGDLTLESSRRGRGFAVWAALRELGRDGVADLVDRCCRLARRMAAGLEAGGAEILNDVVLNQVLVGFGDDARADRVVEAVQQDGTCWLGATTWHGRRLMRVSVSNYSTTEDDVDRSVAAILCAARATH